MYNKNQFKKINDKKVLHKIKKHWAVLSVALLGLIGGGAVTTTNVSANTSVNNQGNNNDNQSNQQVNTNQLQKQQPKLVNNNLSNYSSQSNISNTSRNVYKKNQNENSANDSINSNNSLNITKQAKLLHNHIILNSTNVMGMNKRIRGANISNNGKTPSDASSKNNELYLSAYRNEGKLVPYYSDKNENLNKVKFGSTSVQFYKGDIAKISGGTLPAEPYMRRIFGNPHDVSFTNDNPETNKAFNFLNFSLPNKYNDWTLITSDVNLPSDSSEAFSTPIEYGNSYYGLDGGYQWHQFKSMDLRGINNTQNVINMNDMFGNDTNLQNINMSNWDTRNVSNIYPGQQDPNGNPYIPNGPGMASMFAGDPSLKYLDLSNFDTSNVTDMADMFADDNKLQRINGLSNFDTSNVHYMNGMFNNDNSLQSLDLHMFNTSNVQSMRGMFAGDSSLEHLNLSNFDTSNVGLNPDYRNEYDNLGNIIDYVKTSDVYDGGMSDMFKGDSSLKSLDLSSFNTGKVNGMSDMFKGDSSLKSLNLSNFNTSNVGSGHNELQPLFGMHGMFENDTNLKSLDLSHFNTSKVNGMSDMFKGDSSLKSLDISNFNTQNVGENTSSVWASTSGKFISDTPNMSDMFTGDNNLIKLKLGDKTNLNKRGQNWGSTFFSAPVNLQKDNCQSSILSGEQKAGLYYYYPTITANVYLIKPNNINVNTHENVNVPVISNSVPNSFYNNHSRINYINNELMNLRIYPILELDGYSVNKSNVYPIINKSKNPYINVYLTSVSNSMSNTKQNSNNANTSSKSISSSTNFVSLASALRADYQDEHIDEDTEYANITSGMNIYNDAQINYEDELNGSSAPYDLQSLITENNAIASEDTHDVSDYSAKSSAITSLTNLLDTTSTSSNNASIPLTMSPRLLGAVPVGKSYNTNLKVNNSIDNVPTSYARAINSMASEANTLNSEAITDHVAKQNSVSHYNNEVQTLNNSANLNDNGYQSNENIINSYNVKASSAESLANSVSNAMNTANIQSLASMNSVYQNYFSQASSYKNYISPIDKAMMSFANNIAKNYSMANIDFQDIKQLTSDIKPMSSGSSSNQSSKPTSTSDTFISSADTRMNSIANATNSLESIDNNISLVNSYANTIQNINDSVKGASTSYVSNETDMNSNLSAGSSTSVMAQSYEDAVSSINNEAHTPSNIQFANSMSAKATSLMFNDDVYAQDINNERNVKFSLMQSITSDLNSASMDYQNMNQLVNSFESNSSSTNTSSASNSSEQNSVSSQNSSSTSSNSQNSNSTVSSAQSNSTNSNAQPSSMASSNTSTPSSSTNNSNERSNSINSVSSNTSNSSSMKPSSAQSTINSSGHSLSSSTNSEKSSTSSQSSTTSSINSHDTESISSTNASMASVLTNNDTNITSHINEAMAYTSLANDDLNSLTTSNSRYNSLKGDYVSEANVISSMISGENSIVSSVNTQINNPRLYSNSSIISLDNDQISGANMIVDDARLLISKDVNPLKELISKNSTPSNSSNYNPLPTSSGYESSNNTMPSSQSNYQPIITNNNSSVYSSNSVSNSATSATTNNIKATNQRKTLGEHTQQNKTVKNVPIHWLYVTKTCLAHTNIESVGSNKNYDYKLPKGTIAKVIKTYKIYYNNKPFYRYEIRINGHKYFVTDNSGFTKNEYIQRKELRNNRKAKILVPCFMYRHIHYTLHGRSHYMNKGKVVRIKNIIKIGRKGHFMTRFQLTNGLFITANRKFIKMI